MALETTVGVGKLVIKRVFHVSVERLYQAWTDPAMLVQWFSSNERWRKPLVDVETIQGGRHNITMRHSDGDEFRIVGQYIEVVPNERISFTWKSLNDEMDQGESLVTVEFREAPSGAELTLTHDRLVDPATVQAASGGWDGCLAMLEGYLVDGVALQE